MSRNSFDARDTITVDGRERAFWSLPRFAARGFEIERLPWSLKILLENLLRTEDGVAVRPADIEALAGWDPAAEPSHEIAFSPARVLLQDFTGVPAVV
ncbi:MAG TPA: aconitate hydratase, partial [Gemmatimonadota bacterium]|nr:aconitate hydratase [Gemmatimonadota bacterium]